MKFNKLLDKFILNGDYYKCTDITKQEMAMIRLALKTQDAINDVLDEELENTNSKKYVLFAWKSYENQDIRDVLGYFHSKEYAEKVKNDYINDGFNYYEYQIQKI